MSKYRLIKKYPGSPELGTIASRGMGIQFEHPNGDVDGFISSKGKDFESLIENQPEFWEKIVEKDYQILSFKQDSLMGGLWTEFDHGWCQNSNGRPITYPYSYDDILNSHLNGGIRYRINSIKRLSDGEVFTVGDRIKDTLTNCITNVSEITLKDIRCFLNGVNINYAEKLKQPLFTTEDGVDIYVGDRISIVLLSDMEIFTADGLVGRDTRPAEGFKYFSTKEKAEEYILMNKPCLSVADICTYFDGQLSGCSNLFYLKKLAKSKL